MYQEIKRNLSKTIDESLVDDLLNEYKEIKRYQFLGEHESAITKSGKFIETVLQILKYIISEEIINDPKIDKISEELINKPKTDYPVSIRKIIPRSVKAIYTIRSERGVAHKSDDISPNIIDCEFVTSTCDWIFAEFLRLYHNSDTDEITGIINSLVEKKVPIIEEFEDEICVLSTDMSKKDQMLIILHHLYPERVSNTDLTKWTKGSPQLTHNNLKKAEEEKLVHRKDSKNILTKLGIRKAEEIISQSEIL